MSKVRHAISTLGGSEQKMPLPAASDLETAPMRVPEVTRPVAPPAGAPLQMPAVESKPLWLSAARPRADAESPKILEFPTASEGMPREARLSATEAFMPGAVAPSLPDRVPSAPESKHDPRDTPISSPSVIRS